MTDKDIAKPRFMIAGAGSGSGKTTVTMGLMEAFRQEGEVPVSFKCGPDYIDPMFHRAALCVDSFNLDSYFSPDEDLVRSVGSCNGTVAVIEGVMGIYDGIHPDSIKGSSYEIAKITGTPVILTVNAKGVGRTVIALIKGILADDEAKLIKGIILNRMSDGFFEKIKPVLMKELSAVRPDVRMIGNIPDTAEARIDSRHLGLVLPQELPGIRDKIESLAKVIEHNLNIDTVMEIAEDPVHSAHPAPVTQQTGGRQYRHSFLPDDAAVTLAVARDEAFSFYYRENLDLFEEMGVSIEYFSPLHDEKLPDNISGLLIGGGYPELHLKTLSSNKKMLGSIRSSIADGMPSLAECGGFMYLHDVIESMEKKEYPMAGVIKGVCRYTGRPAGFGYVEIRGADDTENDGLLSSLAGLRGHEFHYYDSDAACSDIRLYKPSSDKEYEGMMAGSDHVWGFTHFYYRSNPGVIEAFIRKMREYGR
ncbi:MAG: cobyrinate a,c-diamide synthase [Lachnospiraceae bacterium]|nr:cobyrinate a,c-diamide synthase [Lachnospiraceae bacterium]